MSKTTKSDSAIGTRHCSKIFEGTVFIALFLTIMSPALMADPASSITVELTIDATTCYAYSPIFLSYSIANESTQPLRFAFSNPFTSGQGLFTEIAGDNGIFLDRSGKRFGVEYASASGVSIQPKERLIWRCFLSYDSENKLHAGLQPGKWRMRARLRDSIIGINVISKDVNLNILPVPENETEVINLLREFGGQKKVEVCLLYPDSVYVPSFLNYLAWTSEDSLLDSITKIDPIADPATGDVTFHALASRRRLRTEYPDWPTNREGFLREAALRFKMHQISITIELLEMLIHKYPNSEESRIAQNVLPRIKEIVSQRDLMSSIQQAVLMTNICTDLGIEEPIRKKIEP